MNFHSKKRNKEEKEGEKEVPNGVISLQMANGSVLNEEMRRKTQGSSSQFEVQECGVSLLSQNRAYIEALFLVKKENIGRKGKSKEKNHDDDDDDYVTTATSDDLVILQDFESVNLVFDESMCIIDSGVTLHVTPRNELFISYTLGDFEVLKMGNDDVLVIGVGDVCLRTNMGVQLWLRGVKHAPNVRFNLIFVNILDDGGYDNHFGYRKWKLTKVALNIEVPDNIWFGKGVKYDHLRVFGCKAFVHVPKDERSRSRDVQFMEDQTIQDIDKNSEQYDSVGDEQLGDVFDAPPNDDVEEEQEMSQDENPGDALEPPLVQLKKSNR
ncbi:hypothetical protein CR513_40493, partial [Mucuna pruriens]